MGLSQVHRTEALPEHGFSAGCCQPDTENCSSQYLLLPSRPSVQFSPSVVCDSVTPWTAARQASLSITNSQSLLKLMSIELVMPSNHLILCRPLLLLPSICPSIRVFFLKSQLFASGGQSIGASVPGCISHFSVIHRPIHSLTPSFFLKYVLTLMQMSPSRAGQQLVCSF